MKTSQNRLITFLPALAALLTVIAASSHAATSSENPFADAFVTTGASNNLVSSNYGGAGLLGVSAPGAAQGEFQSVLEFDLSTVRNAFNTQFGAGQWTVQSATLQLTSAAANNPILNTPSAGSFGISLIQNNNVWPEGTGTPVSPNTSGIDFNDVQKLFGSATDQGLGVFSFNGTTSGANIYTLNLASGFVTDILGGSNVTLRMSAAGSINYLFNSKNFGTAGNRPLLTITAVPEPGSLALCAMGFAAVWGWRSFRRRAGH